MKILIGIFSIATVNIYKTADHTAVAQVIHSWVTAVNTVHAMHGSADRLQTRVTRLGQQAVSYGLFDQASGSAGRIIRVV